MRPLALALALALVTGCGAAPPPPARRTAPDRIDDAQHAVVHAGDLWLASRQHGLYRVALSSREARSASIEGAPTALLRTGDGRLLATSSLPTATTLWEYRAGAFERSRTWPQPSRSAVHALIEARDEIVVIDHTRARFVSRDGSTRELRFSRPLKAAHRLEAAWAGADLYAAANIGEPGGGLFRIDAATGAVSEVALERERADLPVTDVIPDSERGGCVLASVGLSHQGVQRGGVYRVCGASVERLWHETLRGCEGRPERRRQACEEAEAGAWQLSALDGGYAVSTDNGIVKLSRGGVERIESAEFELIGGVELSRSVPGVVLIATAVNGAVSDGGGFLLMAPVEPGAR